MNDTLIEFAPLETGRAKELETILNEASHRSAAVLIEPDRGVAGTSMSELISPTEDTNGLVRYQRHYRHGAAPRERGGGRG